MAKPSFTTLYNARTGQPWECPVGAVEAWTSQKDDNNRQLWVKTAPGSTSRTTGTEGKTV